MEEQQENPIITVSAEWLPLEALMYFQNEQSFRTVLSERLLSLFFGDVNECTIHFLNFNAFSSANARERNVEWDDFLYTRRLEKFSRAARKLEIGTSVIATL